MSAVETRGASRVVSFADGGTIEAHTAILATGVAYRQLDAPGADALTGRGIFYGAALTEAMSCADQDVYIVGGANSAGQAAMHFAQRSRSVTMLVRGESLTRVDVVVPHRPDRGDAQHQGPHLHQRRWRRTAPTTSRASPCSTLTPARRNQSSAQWLFIFIGAAAAHGLAGETV